MEEEDDDGDDEEEEEEERSWDCCVSFPSSITAAKRCDRAAPLRWRRFISRSKAMFVEEEDVEKKCGEKVFLRLLIWLLEQCRILYALE
mmetsp:Transcript_20698/g.25617  ORF Transcript_20698/g.25617 Transcript_20698/m.25617 type:complete len:89 (+) Transcript_20698:989-1255(+)